MLSVCIPVYNFYITRLVNDLADQAEKLGVEWEILLVDDGSDEKFRKENSKVTSIKNVSYEELSKNVGRSVIRNLLAEKATYRYLIFMDCDSQICDDNYLKNYLNCCHSLVVCYGGRRHPTDCPDEKKRLRWKYGLMREDIPAEYRKRNPNASFITFNFLIDKTVFEVVDFEESLKGYGHEDTLFGIELKHKQIIVEHIDNLLVHIGLEDSDTFIRKIESGIDNLVKIQENFDESGEFTSSVKLLEAHRRISKLHLNNLGSLLFRYTKNILLKNLLGKNPNMRCLDFYKLGYLCFITSKK